MATAAVIEKELAREAGVGAAKAHAVSQKLRDAGLLPKGQNPAPHLGDRDVVTMLAALLCDSTIAAADATTLAFLSARRCAQLDDDQAETDARVFRGLAIGKAVTLGEALTSIVTDIRSGAFDAWRRDVTTPAIQVTITDAGASVAISAMRRGVGASILQFAAEERIRVPALLIRRSITFDEKLLGVMASMITAPA